MDAGGLVAKVELHLRCMDLPKMDLMSASDPFVVVYIKDGQNGIWRETARTSTIKNNSNPEWSDHIVVDYKFEVVQPLKFEVYDRDSKSEKLSKHDFLGAFETTMSKMMGSRGCTVSGVLDRGKNRRKKGKIIISGQENSSSADLVTFQMRAKKLDRKNFFGLGKSDPFYVFSQAKSDGSFVRVFEGEVKKANLSPTWKVQRIPVQRLCNGDLERPLLVEIFDWESNGKHQFIGSFKTSVSEMQRKRSFEVWNKNGKGSKKKANPKASGTVELMSFEIEKRHSFLEYIQGGCEINLMVAIDFTASNGHPLDAISLHKIPQNFNYTGSTNNIQQLNQYQSAIWSVGRILQDYDHDRQIPVYGFGAKLPGGGDVSHCFPLTFDNTNVEVEGVEGIMDVYDKALQEVTLSGPTFFAPILQQAVELAKMCERSATQKYVVLLILTDGIINDMDATVKEIVDGASLPLSIIIVGVGDADFSNMEVLDGDEVRLTYFGKRAERDIVQFVPYNEVFKKGPTALAEEVLQEVPEQLTSYFKSKNISPQALENASRRHFIPMAASTRSNAVLPVAQVVEGEVASAPPVAGNYEKH